MGENWSGFSGSYPFGNVAYAAGFCESARSGGDAHPASSSAATTPERIIHFLCLILSSVLLIRQQVSIDPPFHYAANPCELTPLFGQRSVTCHPRLSPCIAEPHRARNFRLTRIAE